MDVSNNTNNKAMEHGPVYRVHKIRMLNWLMDRGWEPFETIREPSNPRFYNWLFHNSPEFEEDVRTYIKQQRARKRN